MTRMSQLTAYGALIYNGEYLYKSTEPMHIGALLVDIGRQLLTYEVKANRFSGLEIRFSRRPFTLSEDKFLSGLDQSLITHDDSELDPETQAALSQAHDSLWLEYMSITSADQAANISPEQLAKLRNHVAKHYPLVPLRW
jgi:hypothetical protein